MLLASVGWKRGCQTFSCPWSENVTYYRKEICSKRLFKASIPAIPFGKSKHPLPTRSLRLLRAAVRSTSSALCLHYACKRCHAFVEDSGFVSHAEKHRSCHGVVVSKVCYGILDVFFPICHVDYCNVSRWTVGRKRGCQPFSCPFSRNVTHCRKEICSTCLSRESILRNSKHRGS